MIKKITLVSVLCMVPAITFSSTYNMRTSAPNLVKEQFSSCKEILDSGKSRGSGVYQVIGYSDISSLYCDMETNGGGWSLVAWNKGHSGIIKPDMFVAGLNIGNISSPTTKSASSLKIEDFSRVLNTQDAMIISPYHSASPVIDNNTGNWDYNKKDCSGYLGHTSRTGGCTNHGGNDNYQSADLFNIAIYSSPGIGASKSINPSYHELCWSGGGSCDFQFFLR